MKLITTSIALLTAFCCCGVTRAAVPLLSSDELKSESTEIVVGKVRAVYSTTRKSENWEETDSVAEIAVVAVEKGTQITSGDVVYAHYWDKRWIGTGTPEPHASGHGGVNKDEFVRAHLVRQDGSYRVLLPNGFAKLESEEVQPQDSDTLAEIALRKLQGKWVRTIVMAEGTFKIVKEHLGNKTTVTYYDPEKNVVAAKTSEFSLENNGRVQIFTFFNNVFTAGPLKGGMDKAPKSYIYRVTEDAFFEINGMLVGDDEEPLALVWRRVKAL